jgi:hypothetical protein
MEQRTVVQSNEAVSHFRLPNVFFYRDERTQIGGRFLLDTSLSSTASSNISTRHLNATLENRNNVEKFNTRLRFLAAPDASCKSTKWKVEKSRSGGSATCREQQD